MILHHALTFLSIFFSVSANLNAGCFSVMLLHDLVDIPLYSGKIFSYLGKKTLADISLFIFAVLCIYLRVWNFIWIIINLFKNANKYEIPNKIYYWCTVSVLIFLEFCHLYWTSKIITVLKEYLTSQGKIRDNRSDSD